MSLDNPDRRGFIGAINPNKSMGTWNTNQVIPQNIYRKLIGTSKFVYTKRYYSDGRFDKYKWYDIYNN